MIYFTFLALMLMLDSQNAVSRLFMRRVVRQGNELSQDFTIMVPVYGDPSYFKNQAFLEKRYKKNTLLVVGMSNDAMRRFADSMEADRWKVCRIESEQGSIVKMLREAIPCVRTKFIIRLDADTTTEDDLFRVVADIERSGADLCSMKVQAANTRTLVEAVQAVEYRMAMLGRRMRPWLTSGACMIARAASYQIILDNHSEYFPGEDIEMGRVAKHFKMRVMHHPAIVLTIVPDRWRDLVRQRKLWWCGSFRHSIINLEHNLRFPVWTMYNAGAVWVLLSFKWDFTPASLAFLPILVVAYILVTVISNWEVRSPLMVLFPLYALFQVMVMPVLGFVMYIRMGYRLRLWGRYRFGLLRPRELLT